MSVAQAGAGVYEEVARVSERAPGVTAVYVTAEDAADRTTAVSGDFLYTAGDKLRITLPK